MKHIHWYYKFLIFFLIFFSMFFFFYKDISSYINNSNYKYYIDSIFMPISEMQRSIIFNYKNTIKENNSLKQRILKDETILSENESLKEEIKELKNMMNLKKLYTSYKAIYAKTVIRNKMYWYNTITIDKGRKDGIKKGQAVVGVNGLIGIVTSVTIKTSTVKLITSNNTSVKIFGYIKKQKEHIIGLIEGYEYPYIKVSLISNPKDIKVGDRFYSYGLDNFPRNIYIGDIKKIQGDNYDLGSILYIETKQDMNDINYVAVLSD